MPDGKSLIYSSLREDDQTEIIEYFIKQNTHNRLTRSSGSEYSPTLTPDGKSISTIILEKDGTQLLWKYPRKGGKPSVLVADLKIGYHCWFDQSTIVSFVLGEPATLQVCDLTSGENQIILSNPGRSLHKVPGKNLVSFVDKNKDDIWVANSFDPANGEIVPLFPTLSQSQDMAWTATGIAVMGKGSELFQIDPESDDGWLLISDLAKFKLDSITRLSVSPKMDYLAIVATAKN